MNKLTGVLPKYDRVDNPPFTDRDILKFLPTAKVLTLDELSVLDNDIIVVLIPFEPHGSEGHWVLISDGINYYNSLGQPMPNKLKQYNLNYSPVKHQSDTSVDCAKFVILKGLNKDLSNNRYNRLLARTAREHGTTVNKLIDFLIN